MRYNTRRGCEDKMCRFLHVCCEQDPATEGVWGQAPGSRAHRDWPVRMPRQEDLGGSCWGRGAYAHFAQPITQADFALGGG